MTLFELMPSVWLILAFVFFAVYFLFDVRLFLIGCGGSLLSLCPALLGAGIFLQTSLFFLYIAFVYALCLIKRLFTGSSAFRGAIAVTRIDCRGGYILYKGRIRRAYPRDRLYEYRLGDVLTVTAMPDGSLCAYRI